MGILTYPRKCFVSKYLIGFIRYLNMKYLKASVMLPADAIGYELSKPSW